MDSKCTTHFPAGDTNMNHLLLLHLAGMSGVKGPSADASASPGPSGSFLSTLHVCYVCAATGECAHTRTSRSQFPIPLFAGSHSLFLFPAEILPCGAWAGPSLCQHCHHPIRHPHCTSGEQVPVTPMENRGSWAQGPGEWLMPCLGRGHPVGPLVP